MRSRLTGNDRPRGWAFGTALTVALVAALALAAPSGAESQEYPPDPEPPGGVSISCSPTVISVGELLSCTASGFAAGADVAFRVNPPLASSQADASGRASISVVLPELNPGSYSVTATGQGGDGTPDATASTRIEVVNALTGAASNPGTDPDPASIGLPVTGSTSTVPIAVVAAVLLAAGAFLLLGARRARRT